MDPFTIAMFGLSAYQAYAGQKQEKQQAGIQSKLIGEQLQGIEKSLGALGEVRGAQEQVVKGEYEFGASQVGFKQGQELQSIQQQYKQASAQSGLKTAAGAEEYKMRATGQAETAFAFQQEGLFAQLGKALGGIDEWYSGEKERLGGEATKLGYEKKQMKEKEKGFYFGSRPGLG